MNKKSKYNPHVRSLGNPRILGATLCIATLWVGLGFVRAAYDQNAKASHSMIITFGTNTPGWNEKLNLNGIRMGCDKRPDECIQRLEHNIQTQQVDKVFLAIKLDPETSTSYALRYSELSLSHPALHEIGIDDFISAYWHLTKAQADALQTLQNTISNVRSANRNLKFGVTLYETDFASDFIKGPKMPPSVRDRIDYVHLYLHHRKNAIRYPQYVDMAKALFHNAEILAGSYPFDRIDYMSCSEADKAPIGKLTDKAKCSQGQEVGLYKQSLEIQARLLQRNAIDGIEFYPAEFGTEDAWAGWKNPNFCRPERKRECIDNTKKMHDIVLDLLGSYNPTFPPEN